MPASSIDTFFACTLIVTVVVVSMVATTMIVAPYIGSLHDLNEESYLQKIVDHMIMNSGSPGDWGQNPDSTPDAYGLAEEGSFGYALDRDKVSRLNSSNVYALNYLQVLQALRLEKVAFRIAFSQILDVSVTLTSNETVGASTLYSFNVSVSRDQAPVATSLQCYILADNYLNNTVSSTSSNGEGVVDVEVPNASNGTALLIVFARASYDDRVTAQGAYAFGHLSSEPSPNNTFLSLSPLNSTLQVDPNFEVSLEDAYQFSYGYDTTLTSISNETYAVPEFLDSSPKILAVTGWNGSIFFIEWVTYPQVPLEIGANFENTECFSFNYLVTIDRAFYRMNVQCGGPSH
jgi:hypothetical protein